MKLFVIYSDLSDNEKEWKEALTNIVIDYKHQACIVTKNVDAVKARLAAMGGLDAVKCLEMEDNICSVDQIEKARKLTEAKGNNIYITMADLEKAKEFQRAMPDAQILMMTSYEKSPFEKLKGISRLSKRTNSGEFNDINNLLGAMNFESSAWWPVEPKQNIEAQRSFLVMVLSRADNFPEESREDCILKTKAYFESKGMLKNVLFSPPNVTGLRWGIFGSGTPTAKLLAEAEAKVKVKKADARESARLLSSAQRTYGT